MPSTGPDRQLAAKHFRAWMRCGGPGRSRCFQCNPLNVFTSQATTSAQLGSNRVMLLEGVRKDRGSWILRWKATVKFVAVKDARESPRAVRFWDGPLVYESEVR